MNPRRKIPFIAATLCTLYGIKGTSTESANNHTKSIVCQGRSYSPYILRVRTLFANAKHKVRKQSFKSGVDKRESRVSATVNEDKMNYGVPTEELFINNGVIIPHAIKNELIGISTRQGEYTKFPCAIQTRVNNSLHP
jgi:hypothetical protein